MPDKKRLWVRLDIPSRFRMGPQRIAELCGWRTRRDPEGLLVCLEEAYRRSRPTLLIASRLADVSTATLSESYDALRSWPAQDEYRGQWAGAADAEVRRRLDSDDVGEWLYGWQLMLLTAPDAEIPRLVRESFVGTILGNFSGASLWTVRVGPHYHPRLAIARALFGALEAPELLQRSPEEFMGFASGRELSSNIFFGMDSLLEPALMATAPSLLGVASMRLGGSVVVLFGEPIAGIKNTPVPELIHLFRPRVSGNPLDATLSTPPNLDRGVVERFLRWWVERLNELFGVVLDPARFTDGAGTYDPRSHYGTILSLERLFGMLQALLAASHRDEFVRRMLLFDVLDLLDGLGFADFRTLLTLSRARSALERVRSTGAGAAFPTIAKCEAAVAALERVGEGFFLYERRREGYLRARRKDGSWEDLSLENAVADYLRVLRNSTHSFMGHIRDERDLSLLGAHTGELPHGLPDLAFLHVLDLLLDPERLSRTR